MFKVFRRKTLIFEFSELTNQKIHSYFCREFKAIWLDEDNKIIEERTISPFKSNIAPNKKYKTLIEIPL